MTGCERHAGRMVPDCGGCREAIRTAVRVERRPDCGERQRGCLAACERPQGHEGEHRAELMPGHTYCAWESMTGPVSYRSVTNGWRD